MKPIIIFLSPLLLIMSMGVVAESDNSVLAKRGKGVVTQQEFTARVAKIPADKRLPVLRDDSRLQDVIMGMLMRAQMAADAREAGYDKEEIVQQRMRLAAESELGDAWMEHYVTLQPEANYEAMAKETYLLNQENMLSAETIDVSHILISTKDRSNSEAYDLANTIIQQLDANPDSFDELVLKYSEDPSAASNQGRFKNVKKGDMVAEFEEAAFALPEGGISTAVQTQYGYHIVRLDARNPVTKASYDEVKDELMASERIRHRDRLQQDYIRSLASMDAIMTKEAMEELVRRLFADKNGNLEQDAELTE